MRKIHRFPARAGGLLLTLLVCLSGSMPAGAGSADEWCRVRWVNDGDTVVLLDGRRVRYLGIDTPEIDHEQNRAEPLGYEARDYNRRLVTSGRVRLEFDVQRHDHYGRLLAYVFLADGSMVNARLLAAGYAYYLFKAPNSKYADLLLARQRAAMTAGLGIWRHWRKDRPTEIIANRKSRRYHSTACRSAGKIHRHRRMRYHSHWDALWDGYAPAGDCLPKGIVFSPGPPDRP
jgi:endonuclease YncB( thermonuclease family)